MTQPHARCKTIAAPRTSNCSCLVANTCVTKQTLSTPRTAMAVKPVLLAALKAYSTWYNRPSGEKMVLHKMARGRAGVGCNLHAKVHSMQECRPINIHGADHAVLTSDGRSHCCLVTSASGKGTLQQRRWHTGCEWGSYDTQGGL